MAICSRCGAEFDLTSAKMSMGHTFYPGVYDEYYPDGDVCACCALPELSADYNAGGEIAELMGDSWDDD